MNILNMKLIFITTLVILQFSDTCGQPSVSDVDVEEVEAEEIEAEDGPAPTIAPICPSGQRWNDCGSACPPTCDPPIRPGPVLCTLQCVPELCTGGQDWRDCGSTCVRTCSNPNPVCNRRCQPRCQCPADTLWHQGRCIPSTECAGPTCPGELQALSCHPGCMYSCTTPTVCALITHCSPGCFCPPDRKYRTSDDRCLATLAECAANPCEVGSPLVINGVEAFCGLGPTSQRCPGAYECIAHPADAFAVCCLISTPECTGGQVWASCGSACTPTCENPNLGCTQQCVAARCQCPRSAPIWHQGRCVAQLECPVCTGGQEWRDCGSTCVRTCSNPNPVCNRRCQPRCQCPADTLWHQGRCIPSTECAGPTCPGELQALSCHPGCMYSCTTVTTPTRCALITHCAPGCFCPPDRKYRTSDERCLATLKECAANPCEVGSPLVINGVEAFCGRGSTSQRCPDAYECIAHEAYVFAVCCLIPPPTVG